MQNNINEITLNINGKEEVFVRKDVVKNTPDSEVERVADLIGECELSVYDAHNIAVVLVNTQQMLKYTSVVDTDVDFLVKRTGLQRSVVEGLVNNQAQIKRAMEELKEEVL